MRKSCNSIFKLLDFWQSDRWKTISKCHLISVFLGHGSANFFCKGSYSKYGQLCSCMLSVLTTQLCSIAWDRHRQNINECAWLCANNKTVVGQVWLGSYSVPIPPLSEYLFICLSAIYIYCSVNCSQFWSIFFIDCCSFS